MVYGAITAMGGLRSGQLRPWRFGRKGCLGSQSSRGRRKDCPKWQTHVDESYPRRRYEMLHLSIDIGISDVVSTRRCMKRSKLTDELPHRKCSKEEAASYSDDSLLAMVCGGILPVTHKGALQGQLQATRKRPGFVVVGLLAN